MRDVGEDRLVGAILERMRAVTSSSALVVAAGDDAAVLAPDGAVVVSTDTLVAGVDFRADWSPAGDVGAKAAAATLADIAAMGARPETLLVSLTVPPGTDVAWVLDLAGGVAEECARAGATVSGGDVAAGGEVVVTGSAVGRLEDGVRAVLRSGARPGDVVAVAGVLGDSAAGLHLLVEGLPRTGPAAAHVLARHRRPRPDYPAGVAAAVAGAGALIDVSDGLVRDARRVAAASGVVLDLDPAALTPSPEAAEVAAAVGADAADWVMTGGEDHALLATFPPGVPLPPSYRGLGRVLAVEDADAPGSGPGVSVAGRRHRGSGGWVHFTG